MGIIHRDISPDNIIFRDRDKLPVLIDFGVVKAGVTQLEVSTQIHQGTTVGKAGYAPGEQLQTGEAYANSDSVRPGGDSGGDDDRTQARKSD